MHAYTIRHIGDQLHRNWKSMSASKGLTMRHYVIHALLNQISLDKKERKRLEKERKRKYDDKNSI